MKISYYTVLLFPLLFQTNVMFAQTGWNWRYQQPQGDTLNSVYFFDATIGIVVGNNGTILRTLNGGAYWTAQPSGTMSDLNDVTFADRNNGTVVGSDGTILHTTDAGVNWSPQSSGTNLKLNAVSFWDRDNGVAVGDFGMILCTTDGGTNWHTRPSTTKEYLRDVSYGTADIIIVVGTYGTLLRTSDRGLFWYKEMTGTLYGLTKVRMVDNENGIVVGKTGIVRSTTDGGVSWTQKPGSGINNPRAMTFLNRDTGLVISDNGIHCTTNAGVGWLSLMRKLSAGINDLQIIDDNTLIAVGENGTILRATYSEIVSVEDVPASPSQIYLAQNFPNPFSSSTTIPITLEKPEYVSLRVHNMLGEEVAVLKEERMAAGVHTATWNPAGVPAGMYFYTLRAGAATVTKKMILQNGR